MKEWFIDFIFFIMEIYDVIQINILFHVEEEHFHEIFDGDSILEK